MVTAVRCPSEASLATILIVTSKFTVIENTVKAVSSVHLFVDKRHMWFIVGFALASS